MNQEKQNGGTLKELWLGIGIAVGLHLLGFLFLFTPGISGFFFIYIFLAPIAYIILTVIAFTKGKTRLGQGLLIGLGVDILLFAACFGVIVSGIGL